MVITNHSTANSEMSCLTEKFLYIEGSTDIDRAMAEPVKYHPSAQFITLPTTRTASVAGEACGIRARE